MQAKFERFWLINPEQFNPLRNCLQRERLERTWALIKKYVDPAHKLVADIGCGARVFSRRLRDAGAQVEAIDIAQNALKHLEKHDMSHIQAKQDAMPTSSLLEEKYEVIVCTDVIAYLPKEDFRQFFWDEAGISHLIFIAKRRPFITEEPFDRIPIEKSKRKEI